MQRRLAAILAADVVGYSRLMDTDEARMLDGLRALREEVFEPTVDQHRGHVIKRMGDGWLVEFHSVLDAVSCAVAVQEELADHAFMKLRMGIHLGDIVHEGEDIYGSGVNIAARLEAIARPGGLCVSDKVFDEVKRKLEVRFVDGGEQTLKNIEDRVRVYHLADGVAAPSPEPSATAVEPTSVAPPRVAVQPLQVVGVNAELEALAQGLLPGLLDGFAKNSALKVAASAADGVDFMLAGTARAAGDRLRLTFTLTDLSSSTQIWSERYDRRMDDLLELEDEIVQAVVYAVRLELKSAEFQTLKDRPDDELAVPDLLSKAAGYLVRWHAGIKPARHTLSLALEKAPTNAMAHAMMVGALFYEYEFTPLALRPSELEAIEFHCDQALTLEGAAFFEHLIKALVLAEFHDNFSGAKIHAETALHYNSGLAPAEIIRLTMECHLGADEDRLADLQRLIATDRTGPHRFRQARDLAICLLRFGREPEAAEVMRRILAQGPELKRNQLVLAATLMLAGDSETAERTMADLLADFPGLNAGTMRPTPMNGAALRERFTDALVRAGMPTA